jgi:hypothetical protein
MSLSMMTYEKLRKVRNFRQQTLRKRRLQNLKCQAFFTYESSNNSTVSNCPKKKSIIVTIYERWFILDKCGRLYEND